MSIDTTAVASLAGETMPAGDINVAPLIRVVPSGVRRKSNGQSVLRATLMITPAPSPQNCNMTLQAWPAGIVGLFRQTSWRLPLRIYPVIPENSAQTGSQGWPVEAHAVRLESTCGKDTGLAGISKLWTAAFEGKSTTAAAKQDAWNCLKSALDPNQDSAIKPGAIGGDTDAAYGQPVFGDKGQLLQKPTESGTREVDAIYATPHGELALALEYDRADDVATSLRMGWADFLRENDPDAKAAQTKKSASRIEGAREHLAEIRSRAWAAMQSEKRNSSVAMQRKPRVVASLTGEEIDLWRTSDDEEKKRELVHKALSEFKKAEHKKYYDDLENNRETSRAIFREAQGSSTEPQDVKTRDLSKDWSTNLSKTASAILRESKASAAIAKGTAAHSYASWGAHRNEGTVAKTEVSASKADARLVSQTFFTMQSTPALARLFCLAIDVEIAIDSANGNNAAADWISSGGAEKFICIGAQDGAEGQVCGMQTGFKVPATLAKLTLDEKDGKATQFWPATREELAACQQGTCTENNSAIIDGYRTMSSGWVEGAGGAARFDLTSLDVRAATEMRDSLLQSREARQHPNKIDDGDEASEHASRDGDLAALGAIYQTAGIALLDRGARAEKATALAIRSNRKLKLDSKPYIMDATDLTVGLRLDVGIPTPGSSDGEVVTQWRPLMNRLVDYGRSGEAEYAAIANSLMPQLAGLWKSPDRVAFEAGLISVPDQLLPKGKTPVAPDSTQQDISETNLVEMVVAENIATWTGSPMGQDAVRAAFESVENGTKMGDDGDMPVSRDIMPFGREVSLPTTDGLRGTALPPRLRYGWPYRFALRSVFSGGASVAPGALDENEHGRFPYPPSTPAGIPRFFRFLRQKAIDRPVVLLPESKVAKPDGMMGHQSASSLVVRSGDGRVGEGRKKPEIAQRVILPPSVSMEEAARHGVFDRVPQAKRPLGAYRGFEWGADEINGGFPVVRTRSARGFNEATFPIADREIASQSLKAAGLASLSKNPKFELISYGDGVLTGRGEERGASQPQYYPDPAAYKLVVALRVAGTRTYLPGDPLTVELHGKTGSNPSYPNAAPVVVTVRRAAHRPTNALPKQSDIFAGSARPVRLDPSRDNIASPGAGGEAREITLRLAPGDEFEVDCWYVPTVGSLATRFSVIQSMAILAGAKANESGATADQQSTAGLPNILGEALAGKYAPNTKKPLDREPALVGPGGFAAPSNAFMMGLAELVEGVLVKRPVPEIAAVTTLEAVHASNVLKDRVAITEMQTTGKQRPVRVARIPADVFFQTEMFADDPPIVENERSVYLTGDIAIDLRLVGGFDIIARAPSPANSTMDDPKRTRSIAEKRAGSWPWVMDELAIPYLKTTQQIYGFEVDRGGRVKLPEASVVLFEVRNLPPTVAQYRADPVTGLSIIPLEKLLYRRPHPSKDDPFADTQVTPKHSFPDCKGRPLEFRINALPRTVGRLTTVNRREGQDFVPATPLSPEHASTASAKINVDLKGSERPSELSMLTPLHRFHWMRGEDGEGAAAWKTIRRDSVIRIPFSRGWYSAASDEKVAIVIWPPNWATVSTSGNAVQYKAGPMHEPRTIVLNHFQDSDLDIGGRFITRWGADPLRENQNSRFHFLDHRNFLDWKGNIDRDATKIADGLENVQMPIFEEQSVKGTQEKTNKLKRFLNVGLLVYEPLFDPETDQWYIDVKLRHPSFDAPFVRFGLVRYVKRTREDLQLSQPTVQWAQLLPPRTVSYRFDALKRSLSVTVSGRSSLRRDDGPISGTPTGPHARAERAPYFYARLFRETKKTPNRATMRQAVELQQQAPPTRASEVSRLAGSLRPRPWQKLRLLDDEGEEFSWGSTFIDLPEPDPGQRLALYLEEVEYRRPATYPREPVTPEALETYEGDIFAESGPRFSCRIEIDT
ncbi:hypothetical protein GOL82_26370 [Sinorhizobium medicae]|nr:hypothetical protein [Sinorhizobium medicae]MDX0420171.1 hypothetical protein [Sinorhizobium medicae]MDX1034719.1 hypothetical protein [Sinorhizobium medicae]